MVFNAPKLDYLWLGRTHSFVDVLPKTDVSQIAPLKCMFKTFGKTI